MDMHDIMWMAAVTTLGMLATVNDRGKFSMIFRCVLIAQLIYFLAMLVHVYLL